MIGDREYYYIPISLHAAWKVTKNEESDAVNKEEIEYKVRQRLYRLKSRRQRNEKHWNNIIKKAVVKITDVDPIPVTVARENMNQFIKEEKDNIKRVASELGKGLSSPVLHENG